MVANCSRIILANSVGDRKILGGGRGGGGRERRRKGRGEEGRGEGERGGRKTHMTTMQLETKLLHISLIPSLQTVSNQKLGLGTAPATSQMHNG